MKVTKNKIIISRTTLTMVGVELANKEIIDVAVRETEYVENGGYEIDAEINYDTLETELNSEQKEKVIELAINEVK